MKKKQVISYNFPLLKKCLQRSELENKETSASTEVHTCVQAGVIIGIAHVLKMEHVLYAAEQSQLAFLNSKLYLFSFFFPCDFFLLL